MFRKAPSASSIVSSITSLSVGMATVSQSGSWVFSELQLCHDMWTWKWRQTKAYVADNSLSSIMSMQLLTGLSGLTVHRWTQLRRSESSTM